MGSQKGSQKRGYLGTGSSSEKGVGPGFGKGNILDNSKSICKTTNLREITSYAEQSGLAEVLGQRRTGEEGSREQPPSQYSVINNQACDVHQAICMHCLP